jgi:NAD(P)H-hydrate epimerase
MGLRIPAITTQQMMEVDRLMIQEYGIHLLQMMENAGRNLGELGRRMLGGTVRAKRIAILCGTGNNGGGGMAAARHFHNWGAKVVVKVIPSEEQLKDIPAHQFRILEAMEITKTATIELEKMDLIVDAMIGYGLTGDPRGSIADWISRVNDASRSVLALDSPSGLDLNTGIPGSPCIRATATMTLALPKVGLLSLKAKPFVGDLYLADIGIPPELFAFPSLGLNVGPIFIRNSIVSLKR